VDPDATERHDVPGGAPRRPAPPGPPEPDAIPEPPVVAVPDAGEPAARLAALDLARSGTPREEAARLLAGRCDPRDLDALLDDVYRQAGA
jgi:hypothetical protein